MVTEEVDNHGQNVGKRNALLRESLKVDIDIDMDIYMIFYISLCILCSGTSDYESIPYDAKA